ncbi:MAG: helix-turn-helix domain-containing protein [Nitratireductor sp.]
MVGRAPKIESLEDVKASELDEAKLEAQDASASDIHVGLDIRSMRKARGMTLLALCDALGRSSGWLSQVERGHSQPSINDLRAIGKLFDTPVSFFFRNETAPESERGLIVRSGSRAILGSREAGLTEELLSPDISGDFEMIRSEFAPGASGELSEPRKSQEGGYIISGSLELTLNNHIHVLNTGDSFQFQKTRYRWENPGTEPCVVVWVISPPIY